MMEGAQVRTGTVSATKLSMQSSSSHRDALLLLGFAIGLALLG